MTSYWMSVDVLSDATFGGGTGVAGLIDVEIDHDADGCPFLGGRALKGLLLEEYVNIRYALGDIDAWDAAATALFGRAGAMNGTEQSVLHVGAAQLPAGFRAAIRDNTIRVDEVLNTLTTIRRQTSITAEGGPEQGSLRAMRALLRDTPLLAHLDTTRPLTDREQALLATCTLGVRRAGVARNRGRGRLALRLHIDEPMTTAEFHDCTTTERLFTLFASEVQQ